MKHKPHSPNKMVCVNREKCRCVSSVSYCDIATQSASVLCPIRVLNKRKLIHWHLLNADNSSR